MVELREDRPVRHPISKKRVQNAMFRSRGRTWVDDQSSHSARRDRPRPARSGCTHTSASEDKEEEENGFDLVVEGEIDDERVYCALVCRDATLFREGIGDDQERVSGSKAYEERRDTQTVQMVMMPFISRLRWVIALVLGWPPLRGEGEGILRTLYVS